jgi:hypothetical protein
MSSQILAGVKERLEAAEKTIAGWAEDKPWINENETKSAVEKVSSTGVRALVRLQHGIWHTFMTGCSPWHHGRLHLKNMEG